MKTPRHGVNTEKTRKRDKNRKAREPARMEQQMSPETKLTQRKGEASGAGPKNFPKKHDFRPTENTRESKARKLLL